MGSLNGGGVDQTDFDFDCGDVPLEDHELDPDDLLDPIFSCVEELPSLDFGELYNSSKDLVAWISQSNLMERGNCAFDRFEALMESDGKGKVFLNEEPQEEKQEEMGVAAIAETSEVMPEEPVNLELELNTPETAEEPMDVDIDPSPSAVVAISKSEPIAAPPIGLPESESVDIAEQNLPTMDDEIEVVVVAEPELDVNMNETAPAPQPALPVPDKGGMTRTQRIVKVVRYLGMQGRSSYRPFIEDDERDEEESDPSVSNSASAIFLQCVDMKQRLTFGFFSYRNMEMLLPTRKKREEALLSYLPSLPVY